MDRLVQNGELGPDFGEFGGGERSHPFDYSVSSGLVCSGEATVGASSAVDSVTLKVIFPSSQLTSTLSPSLIEPLRSSSAIGSSRCRSTARRIGRAP